MTIASSHGSEKSISFISLFTEHTSSQIIRFTSTMDLITQLLLLTVLEIILGIDNLLLASIQVERLNERAKKLVWNSSLFGAGVLRIVLLYFASWLTQMKHPVLTMAGQGFSISQILLLIGGIYLLYQTVTELIHKVRREEADIAKQSVAASAQRAFWNIMALNLVFSIDSVMTAVGLTKQIAIMVTAIVISIAVMWALAKPVIKFMQNRPEIQILALAFLIVIAIALIAEGMGHELPRGYIYFAMAFSAGVDFLQSLQRRKVSPT